MITVTVRADNTNKTIIVDENTSSPRECFAKYGIRSENKQVSLNGTPVARGDDAKTFAALGVVADQEVSITSVVKSDGAAA